MTDRVADTATENRGAVLRLVRQDFLQEHAHLLGMLHGLGTRCDGCSTFRLVISTLTAIWTISRADAGLVATATLLASSAGGWLVGVSLTGYGRVRMLLIEHSLVLHLHVPLRVCTVVSTAADLPCPAGIRVRRRMGRRRGADRRDDPRQAPRQGQRHRAQRLGCRLGNGGHRLYRAVQLPAEVDSMALCCSASACCRRWRYSSCGASSTSRRCCPGQQAAI